VKVKILYPSRLMKAKPKTRFEYFQKMLKGEMVYKDSPEVELKKINSRGV